MKSKLTTLSDEELKEWYSHPEVERLLRQSDSIDRDLNRSIEDEMINRGMKHMVDY